MSYKLSPKSLYTYFCRYYSRKLGDRPADFIYRSLCSLKFIKEHGYYPRFKKPRSFSEKIWHRMLFDRSPIWTKTSDKLKARELVKEKFGENFLPAILWQGERPEEMPLAELPDRFVIKTNHGAGYNIIVTDKKNLDPNRVLTRINDWLNQNFTYETFLGMAWAYKNIYPMVYVESFLGQAEKPPLDYKFFCFSGRVEYLQISFDRFGNASERILDRHFNVLDVYNGVRLYDGPIKRPENYDEMIRVAETLSAGFDFIRVDLYNVNGKIYFGELTCYPAGGLAAFVPRKWDFIFGEKWVLENKYK